jgi:hypothetical protein
MAYRGVEIRPKGHRGANDTSQVKDSPKVTNERPLLSLGRVCHHQGSLSRPHQGRTNA